MFDSKKVWDTYWSKTNNKSVVSTEDPEYIKIYGGINNEPHASIGMCSFLEPVKKSFKDGFTILDYGCGAGILANVIGQRLDNFKYFGVEPNSKHGIERISLAKKIFKTDMTNFSFIDDNFSDYYKIKFDCVTLISIFTHLQIEETYKILEKLLPFIENNKETKIIFSCFLSDSYQLHLPQPDINDNFYGVVKITEEQLYSFKKDKKIYIKHVCDFPATAQYIHSIFELGSEEK